MTNLFYRYYDELFASKRYDEEIDCVFSTATKWSLTPCDRILEIGCGTGNHTLELAKHQVPVTAIDLDGHMIAQAREKVDAMGLGNVQFFHGSVESVEGHGFGLAVALFNVVTYVPDSLSLAVFFRTVYERLKPGGVFIFDCWNGVAAIRQPPESKRLEYDMGDRAIRCQVINETDLFTQKTTLHYDISIHGRDGEEIESDRYSIRQTLWTPMQITDSILASGLEKLVCSRLFEPQVEATHQDWKIMFVCRRPLD